MPVTFQRFLNLTNGDHKTDYEKWDGEYSDVTYDIALFTTDLFTRPHKSRHSPKASTGTPSKVSEHTRVAPLTSLSTQR